MSRHHRQVRITVGEWSADIDEGIAHLIAALWQAGIPTVCSCQAADGTGAAWIAFRSVADAKRARAGFTPTPKLYKPNVDWSRIPADDYEARECQDATAGLVFVV